MAEWYCAGFSWLELMAELEELICGLLEGIAIVRGKTIKLCPPLPRITVTEAFHQAGVEVSAWADLNDKEYQERFDQAYVDKLEPWLADQGALFLTHFPAPLAILSRLTGGPGSTAERFELIVGGLEIANGCTELTDPKENLERINRDLEIRRLLGKTASPLPREFLDDLKNLGLPECAGVALGVDRLAMIALGADAIEDVQALPFAT